MDKKSNQRNRILAYLEENGSATNREIFLYLNINSPTKRLSELRQMGLIDSETCTRTNADGETVRFSRYFLREAT